MAASSSSPAGAAAVNAAADVVATVAATAVSRRSAVAAIKRIEVFDFDNTLFKTPVPTKSRWSAESFDQIMVAWWKSVSIFRKIGLGWDRERQNCWRGFWNEELIERIHLLKGKGDVCTVLLTGRRCSLLPILLAICNSRQLCFDCFACKPKFMIAGPKENRDGKEPSASMEDGTTELGTNLASNSANEEKEAQSMRTLDYKIAVFEAIVKHFPNVSVVQVYEDRENHVRAFQKSFDALNSQRLQCDQSAKDSEHEDKCGKVYDKTTEDVPADQYARNMNCLLPEKRDDDTFGESSRPLSDVMTNPWVKTGALKDPENMSDQSFNNAEKGPINFELRHIQGQVCELSIDEELKFGQCALNDTSFAMDDAIDDKFGGEIADANECVFVDSPTSSDMGDPEVILKTLLERNMNKNAQRWSALLTAEKFPSYYFDISDDDARILYDLVVPLIRFSDQVKQENEKQQDPDHGQDVINDSNKDYYFWAPSRVSAWSLRPPRVRLDQLVAKPNRMRLVEVNSDWRSFVVVRLQNINFLDHFVQIPVASTLEAPQRRDAYSIDKFQPIEEIIANLRRHHLEDDSSSSALEDEEQRQQLDDLYLSALSVALREQELTLSMQKVEKLRIRDLSRGQRQRRDRGE